MLRPYGSGAGSGALRVGNSGCDRGHSGRAGRRYNTGASARKVVGAPEAALNETQELRKVAEGREAEMFAWEDGTILRLLREPGAEQRNQGQAAAIEAAGGARAGRAGRDDGHGAAGAYHGADRGAGPSDADRPPALDCIPRGAD